MGGEYTEQQTFDFTEQKVSQYPEQKSLKHIQKQALWSCPECTSCVREKEYNLYLKEIKGMSLSDKANETLRFGGEVWGYLCIIFIALMVGAMFREKIFYLINQWIRRSGISITIGKK